MNFRQLIVLWTGILIIVLNCLYVPFVYSENNLPKGYYFIWKPPVEEKVGLDYLIEQVKGGKPRYVKLIIDFPRLSLQIGVVALVSFGLLFTLSTKKNSKSTKEDEDKSTSPAQPTKPIKKRSILDNPKERRFFEKMGTVYKVVKPDTEDKKNEDG